MMVYCVCKKKKKAILGDFFDAALSHMRKLKMSVERV
jgi:hypothetical protein